MRESFAEAVQGDGWGLTRRVIPDCDVDALSKELTPLLVSDATRGGVRRLLEHACVRTLARSPIVRRIAESVLGPSCFAVRGILFDKSPDANWKVAWHQDVTIAVKERREVAGYDGWSVKEGITHVQPPVLVLEQMLAIRVHLDDCGPTNGPVRVISGSHRCGRLTPKQVDEMRTAREPMDCVVERGGILAFRPLTLHASSPAITAAHRRVVHLEFASTPLHGGLEWLEMA